MYNRREEYEVNTLGNLGTHKDWRLEEENGT
jgi:hypothetical protein